MVKEIPLCKLQKEIMKEFYAIKPTKVIYNKSERNILWKNATARNQSIDFSELNKNCPALAHQIKRSYEEGNNIQSAVFSECVYAQTFANMFQLTKFENYYLSQNVIPLEIITLLDSYNLVPRYVYYTDDRKRMLIQAGGCGGIDSALITVFDLTIYTIEFKEPGAKTSEPDLPKYGEDGVMCVRESFTKKYPQFQEMIDEQKELNFFQAMGSNINDFSDESVQFAASENYTKKYADVICTEDKSGYLTMLPANQAPLWAYLQGEIRPAGRNSYDVWTPRSLRRFLNQLDATFTGDIVSVEKSKLTTRTQRGGNGAISGYKINPLFFVRIGDCKEKNGIISFDINSVRQLNPTITAKMFFYDLDYCSVKKHYETMF